MNSPPSSGSTATQRWDPDRYARNARFVADLGQPVVALLAPRAGERVLDLGCGDGALTKKLAELGVDVVGVDSSGEQVAAACALGVDARVMSGDALTFDGKFDAVFSNAALHWMLRPAEVIAGVWRALKADGRFVGEMGGHGNVQHIASAMIDALDRRGVDGRAAVPWYFPTPDEYGGLLVAHGFEVRTIELIPRPTPLPGHIVDWLDSFTENFTRRVAPAERGALLSEVAAALRPTLCDADGRWTADYVRLRFAAFKPD